MKTPCLRWLRLPDSREPDDRNAPAATIRAARIISENPFLNRVYRHWYARLIERLDGRLKGRNLVEIGSGGGFLKRLLPDLITSEMAGIPGVDMHLDARALPFAEGSLDALLMIDVFHHIPDAAAFLRQARFCLKPGGRIVMIEPANTLWGRFVYGRFHHEDFDPGGDWKTRGSGRLSSGNGALPWIVFLRDRDRLRREFPELRMGRTDLFMPFAYLLSGGLTFRRLLPGRAFPLVRGLEKMLSPLHKYLGMFMTVELMKVADSGKRAIPPVPTSPGEAA